MIEIKDNRDCCGCNACAQFCPKKCIAMQEDLEGFLYPIVDMSVCNGCKLCEKVCPVINQNEPRKPLSVYAAKNKNEQVRLESSSGGMFTLFATRTIEHGGVVFGAKFNDKWEVVHDFTKTIEGLAEFRGSKYVQSRIGETYRQAEDFLKKGGKVLFSGTPCQIAGLKLFLRKEYENLLTVDVICRGVPSPKVWRSYLYSITNRLQSVAEKNLKTLLKSKIVISSIHFRNKNYGWRNFHFVVNGCVSGGTQNSILISETFEENIFFRGFLRGIYERPSCHACPSKYFKSGSDITLADFWNIKYFSPEFDDVKGVSAVYVNTFKGQALFNSINIFCKEIVYDQIEKVNSFTLTSSPQSPKREVFFKKFNCTPQNIEALIKKYTRQSFYVFCRSKAIRLLQIVGLAKYVKKILRKQLFKCEG